MSPRVAIADASAPTRAGLRLALERGGFEVCAEAGDARELVELAGRHAPALVVLPVDLPGDALRAVERIQRVAPGARIVVLTSAQDDDELVAAVLAGASGYLGKDVSTERLPQIMRSILAGEVAVPRRLSGRLLAELRARHRRTRKVADTVHALLTDREWDVAQHLGPPQRASTPSIPATNVHPLERRVAMRPMASGRECRDGDAMANAIEQLIASIDAMIARAAAASDDAPTVDEINDMLSTGYLRALQADGEIRLSTVRCRSRAPDDREIAIARRRTTDEAVLLRARLAVLRAHFLRLRRAT